MDVSEGFWMKEANLACLFHIPQRYFQEEWQLIPFTSGLLGYPFPAAHTLDQSCGCSWHPEALGCYVTGLGQTFWFGRYSLQVKNCSEMQPGCLNTHGGEEALGQRPQSAELESATGPLGSEI